MHRLTITITAPNELDSDATLQNFASQLQDVAEDLAAMLPRSHAFGAYGPQGCKVYYRVELDEPGVRPTASPRDLAWAEA